VLAGMNCFSMFLWVVIWLVDISHGDLCFLLKFIQNLTSNNIKKPHILSNINKLNPSSPSYLFDPPISQILKNMSIYEC